MFTMYAVRHIPSGNFLPVTKKGYTTVEPVGIEIAAPRLHKSHRSAKMALQAWCRGKHEARWEYWSSEDVYSSAGGTYVEEIKIKPMRGRNPDHMEVVEITLLIKEN